MWSVSCNSQNLQHNFLISQFRRTKKSNFNWDDKKTSLKFGKLRWMNFQQKCFSKLCFFSWHKIWMYVCNFCIKCSFFSISYWLTNCVSVLSTLTPFKTLFSFYFYPILIWMQRLISFLSFYFLILSLYVNIKRVEWRYK